MRSAGGVVEERRSARLAAAPEPYGLTTATCPSRATSTAPATPEPVNVGVLDRVERRLGHTAQQHVDRFQPVERAQPHPPVAHRHVGSLGEVVAELGGQVGVLDVAGVVGRLR